MAGLTRLGKAPLSTPLQWTLLVVIAALCWPMISEQSHRMTGTLRRVIFDVEHGGDFIAFYAAGRLYDDRHDASPYDLDQLREMELTLRPELRTRPDWVESKVNPFRNPPFYLPVVEYLASFPLPVGFAVSSVIEGGLFSAFLLVTLLLIAGRVPPALGVGWLLLGLAFNSDWSIFEYAQLPTVIVVLAFGTGILLLRKDGAFLAGLVFALMWIKFQYILPLALFLFIAREWKALLGLIIGSSSLLAASVALVGLAGMKTYIGTVLYLSVAPENLYFTNYGNMYNWRGFLERIPALQGQSGGIFVAELALIGITYGFAIWAWTARRGSATWRRDVGVLLLVLTMVLASPHVHFQDLVLLLPGVGLVARHFWGRESRWLASFGATLLVVLFFWLLPQPDIFGPNWRFSVVVMAFVFVGAVFALRFRRIARSGRDRAATVTTTTGPEAMSIEGSVRAEGTEVAVGMFKALRGCVVRGA